MPWVVLALFSLLVYTASSTVNVTTRNHLRGEKGVGHDIDATSRRLYNDEKDITEKIERYPPEREPRPYSEHNKVLGTICMYDFNHIDSFMAHILPEYVSMCEGGWEPTLVVLSADTWSPKVRRVMREMTHCYRTGKSINLQWAIYPKSISIFLAAQHRKYMQMHIDDYDVFMYHEDDIPFKYSHLTAFVQETKKLKDRIAWTGLYRYIIGFQRFHHLHKQNGAEQPWTERDIIEQQLLEETPTLSTECLQGEDIHVNPFQHKRQNIPGWDWNTAPWTYDGDGKEPNKEESGDDVGEAEKSNSRQRLLNDGDWDTLKIYPYIHVKGNTHQGAFMMTQEQLKIAHVKCDFLTHRSPSREYMSSWTLFETELRGCGFQKLIPAERFHSFLIYHVYASKFASWSPTAQAADDTITGKNYLNQGQNTNHNCWGPILNKANKLISEEKLMVENGQMPWSYDIDDDDEEENE